VDNGDITESPSHDAGRGFESPRLHFQNISICSKNVWITPKGLTKVVGADGYGDQEIKVVYEESDGAVAEERRGSGSIRRVNTTKKFRAREATSLDSHIRGAIAYKLSTSTLSCSRWVGSRLLEVVLH
jgi:hypothetical protein